MIVFSEPTIKMLQPITLSTAIKSAIGLVKDARCVGKGKLLIFAVNITQRDKILKMAALNGGRVKCHIAGRKAKVRGVIAGALMEVSIDEFKREVIGVKSG